MKTNAPLVGSTYHDLSPSAVSSPDITDTNDTTDETECSGDLRSAIVSEKGGLAKFIAGCRAWLWGPGA